jgi:hypothetical protein
MSGWGSVVFSVGNEGRRFSRIRNGVAAMAFIKSSAVTLNCLLISAAI